MHIKYIKTIVFYCYGFTMYDLNELCQGKFHLRSIINKIPSVDSWNVKIGGTFSSSQILEIELVAFICCENSLAPENTRLMILESTMITWRIQKVQNSCWKNLQPVRLPEFYFSRKKVQPIFIAVQDFTLIISYALYFD